MDSSGIRMLLGLARRTDEQGQRLVLVVPEGSSLWQLLDIAGVGDAIAIEPAVEEARARLARLAGPGARLCPRSRPPGRTGARRRATVLGERGESRHTGWPDPFG